jgi:K+-transporting ATPase ATPase C chain
MHLLTQLRRSIVAALIFAVLCGLAYPLSVTGIAQLTMAHQANGSLGPLGSMLIGQRFSGPSWFHGRPDPDDPSESGPANLGPRSIVLEHDVAALIETFHRLGVEHPTPELVEGSGSGVDPDISPASAYVQVPMVAHARHLSVALLRRLVASQIHGRELGFLGEPYLDVLELNAALARLR